MPVDRPGLRPGTPRREEREQALHAELERIVPVLKNLGAVKVILFGSVARDEVRANSDLDLIVVMPSDDGFPKRQAQLYLAVSPTVACDMVAYTPEEFEQMPARSTTVRRALREGKALKGVLIANGEQAPRVHAVSELMTRVSRHVELPEKLSVAAALDGYYVPTRYPDMMPEGVPDDAYQEADSSAAMQFAETVLRFAEDEI